MGSGGEFAMLDGIDARSRLLRSSIKEAVAELGYIVVLATPIALTQGMSTCEQRAQVIAA